MIATGPNPNSKNVPFSTLIAVVVVAAILVGVAFYYGKGTSSEDVLAKQREKSSADFVIDSIKAIAGAWNPDELKSRAHPLLLKGIEKSGTSMQDYFKKLSELGKMKNDNKCTFLSLASIYTATEHFALADYGCNVEFDNSKAAIAIEVRQDNLTGPWQILNFKIDSPLFADRKAPEAPKAEAPRTVTPRAAEPKTEAPKPEGKK